MNNRIRNRFEKVYSNKRNDVGRKFGTYCVASVGIAAVLLFLICAYYLQDSGKAALSSESSTDSLQASIASKVLRFHVLANSDSEEDQALKLLVRDAVGEYLEPLISEAGDLSETEEIVMAHLNDVEEKAQAIIHEEGYDYSVDASLAWVEFPEKSYGDYTFPAGEYEALQVVIGEGDGQNWWCVLYPNMCFRGSVYEVIDDGAKEQLRQVLTQEEYEEVFSSGEVEVKFRLLEFIKTCIYSRPG